MSSRELDNLIKLATSAQPVNGNEVIYKLTGVFRATPGEPVVGVDIFPPATAIPINTGSLPDKKFKALGLKLPDDFTWSNYDHVKQNKSELNLPEDWLTPVYNQGLCGSCWAFSTTSCLSDRYAIANKTKSPQLSPTFLLSCDTTKIPDTLGANQKCIGGIPSNAFQFMSENGVPSIFCQDYNWCEKTRMCFTQQSRGSGMEGLNQIVPQCQSSCLECSEQSDGSIRCKPVTTEEFKTYKNDVWPKNELDSKEVYVIPNTKASKTFFGDPAKVITEIKEEIWLRGPVVGCYKLLEDFFARDQLWYISPSGKKIYMNRKGKPQRKNALTRSQYNSAGFHAVVIMGWGTDIGPDGEKLPYWIVKNSWGDHYGDKGYFNWAMYDADKDYNTELNLDVPIKINVRDDQNKSLSLIWCGISAPVVFPKERSILKNETSTTSSIDLNLNDHSSIQNNQNNQDDKNKEDKPKGSIFDWQLILLIAIIVLIVYTLLRKNK
jgi:hypothetical protein